MGMGLLGGGAEVNGAVLGRAHVGAYPCVIPPDQDIHRIDGQHIQIALQQPPNNIPA